jgi:Matrixin
VKPSRAFVFVLFAWIAVAGAPQKYSYWVEPCLNSGQVCQPTDPQLADWALQAWQRAASGALQFRRVQDPRHARIRVFWASGEQGLYGETQPVLVDGKPGAQVYVLPAPLEPNGDRLLRDAIVYLTCLHETGHALGLSHTDVFADIMYSFQYGGDIPEYFARYRRKLRSRDDIRNNSGMSEADRKHLLQALSH